MTVKIILSKKYYLKMHDGRISESYLQISESVPFNGFPRKPFVKNENESAIIQMTHIFLVFWMRKDFLVDHTLL